MSALVKQEGLLPASQPDLETSSPAKHKVPRGWKGQLWPLEQVVGGQKKRDSWPKMTSGCHGERDSVCISTVQAWAAPPHQRVPSPMGPLFPPPHLPFEQMGIQDSSHACFSFPY